MSHAMSDRVRIDEHGNPLNDTWSNYRREHHWAGWEPVVEGIDPQWSRVRVWCERCGQERRVWHAAPASGFRWGCPRVPWRFRLRLWLVGLSLPRWSVNSRPPWLWMSS